MAFQHNDTYHPFPDGFCADKFWDWQSTWYTSDPYFTDCFESTALVWVPCGYLWAMLPFQIYHIGSRSFNIKQWTWNSLLKITFCLLLALLSGMDMFAVVYYWIEHGRNSMPPSSLVAAIVKLATFLLSALIIFADKKRARASSGILFFFWFFMLFSAIIILRSQIRIAGEEGLGLKSFHFATGVISIILIVVQLCISCVSERFPTSTATEKNPCPEQFASFLSEMTFTWFSPMAYLGWKRPLQDDDLWTLLPGDRTKHQIDILEKNWLAEMERMHRTIRENAETKSGKKAYQPSLLRALLKSYWFPLLMSALLRIFNDLSIFVTPQVLRLMIDFVEDKSQPAWKGYFYAGLMLLGSCAQTLILNQYLHMCLRLGMHIRGSIVAIVYRKSLRISSSAKRSSNIGEMVNLMSVDAQRFMEFMAYVQMLWSGPVQMGLSIYFLYDLLGVPVFAGLGTLLVVFFANAFLVGKSRSLQIVQMKEKDGRIKMMSEILNGIKVLKLYAWEKSFQQQVTDIRERELTTLRKAAYLGALGYFSWILSPFLVAIATFSTYILSSPANILNPQRAFVALSLLNILRVPLTLLPSAITMATQAAISLKRLTKFLQNEELDPEAVQALPSNDPLSVQVNNGTFCWGHDEPVCLSNVNIDVKQGQLVAVVGQVGAGKSSLCSALLGLMEKRSGDVAIKGNVAYVPQQAWIQNLTLRENILFGNEMDKERYQKTLDACSLRTDLEMLSGGDETEIGERGTNLSGGQKQRVSLARAVYSNADVYILDDPLSAVDAHVGKHIFENVIGPNGVLKNKTRILVTHGIGFLPQTDLIIVLSGGTVSEVGTYRTLLRNRGAFSDFLRTYLTEDSDALADDITDEIIKEQILEEIGIPVSALGSRSSVDPNLARSMSVISSASVRKVRHTLRRDSKRQSNAIEMQKLDGPERSKAAEKGKLVEAEKIETGSVKWAVYMMLAKQMSYSAALGVTLFYGLSYGSSIGANFWLSEWAKDADVPSLATDVEQRNYRLGIYALLGLLQGLFALVSSFTLAYGRIRASRLSQEGMLHRIMRAPMAFFDSTPLGRIVNRFSKDVDSIDTTIPATLEIWIYCLYSVLSILIVISVNTPPFMIVLLPLIIFYYFMQRYFIATSRQLKRLEAVTRSPIFSHFQESVTGNSVIVATKQSQRFIRDNEQRVDKNNATYYPNIASQRWIAVRFEVVGIIVTFSAAILAVLGREYPGLGIDAEQVGMSISYALSLSQILNWFVRMTSDLESNVVSVERIKEYSEIEIEAEWIKESSRPPPNWPGEGKIEFQGYKTRYRPELDLVLKGVDAQVSAGEKIGIVGRTGAGKSSLTLALFRIIEAAEGSIIIDGLNIADLGLHDVRSRITILPQEPVLFSGTLRLNLDPFGKFTDQEVWLALENSHLSRFVRALPEGLNQTVADGGENYSVGQRQLICLARALLRKTKILVLDEATAAIDLETDALIQATISEKFADCTILTIAHRINTIMDSTRIMVLDQGKVKEFATPEKLLSDESGVFYSLAKAANVLPTASASVNPDDENERL
ncbi:Canalicular multispecific organic anion transporter 2 [Hypsibius exemplaris]|uniref:ABC-type glutathione-S-conjugate transporter n=1 Tax=Hypsibius exemplaris TaxID=2072580 RepID=A0A1W0WQ97_HYPEX|nr:Canalicular multispecific organic anion transporter 2 [Hypsibius exemplaris]